MMRLRANDVRARTWRRESRCRVGSRLRACRCVARAWRVRTLSDRGIARMGSLPPFDHSPSACEAVAPAGGGRTAPLLSGDESATRRRFVALPGPAAVAAVKAAADACLWREPDRSIAAASGGG